MLDKSIPILMYHHVSPAVSELTVSPGLFEHQMQMIHSKGWKTLSGQEFLFAIQQAKIPKKHVLLTFDDGFADNYIYAYPILKKYGMKAMIFVTSSMIADTNVSRVNFIPRTHKESWSLATTERCAEVMCTWNELKEMQDSGVFDVQSHGMTHNTHLLIKDKKYDKLKVDLFTGKREIEQKLLKEVYHLAWPKGVYDRQAIECAISVGFKALYTTKRGANSGNSLTELKRLPVKNKDGEWLNSKLIIYSSSVLTSIYLSMRTGV